ncbi:MAG TPA: porin, partial [Burkholderiaceae bacterium]|nr:porin [Burkholderiaceae bacterium]
LGGGLKAGFVLLAGVNPDSGTTNSKFFNRRSTVSLMGGFGEVRLGRDYTPTFWNQTLFDAFGTNGLGSSLNPRQLYNGTRQDNSIGYFLPSGIGGLYGQFMAGAAEAGTSGDRPARYIGGRVGFAAGPFDIAFGASQERFTTAGVAVGSVGLTGANPPLGGGAYTAQTSQKTYNIGGSYDLGVVKLMGYYDRETLNNLKEDFGSISAVVPLGQGEIHVGYDRSKLKGLPAPFTSATSVDQIKVGYVYNLSKRTALYGTASRLDNKQNTRLTLPGALAGQTTAAGKSQGAEVGIRHLF